LDILSIWVILSGIPLVLWSDKVTEEIGYALGIFYEVDLSFHDSGYFGLARILVGLDISKGLVETMKI